MNAAYTQPQKPEDPNAEYLTVQETAWVFRCSVRTIRRYINNDGAPHSRIGIRIMLSRDDRKALYDLRRSGSAPRRIPSQRRRPTAKRATKPTVPAQRSAA